MALDWLRGATRFIATRPAIRRGCVAIDDVAFRTPALADGAAIWGPCVIQKRALPASYSSSDLNGLVP